MIYVQRNIYNRNKNVKFTRAHTEIHTYHLPICHSFNSFHFISCEKVKEMKNKSHVRAHQIYRQSPSYTQTHINLTLNRWICCEVRSWRTVLTHT